MDMCSFLLFGNVCHSRIDITFWATHMAQKMRPKHVCVRREKKD
jgi:hypothetical protein